MPRLRPHQRIAPHPYPLPVKDGERGASAVLLASDPRAWLGLKGLAARRTAPSPRISRGEGKGEGQRESSWLWSISP
ncbi:hypothetical protein DUP91_27000 [Salmonella enterica subsp. enterica]|nr:hypothetical protein [Salmonella enterica subsp. enterica]